VSVERNTTLDLDTPAAGAWAAINGYDEDDGTATIQTITHTLNYGHTSTTPARVVVRSGVGDLGDDRVYAVELGFNDPGPRSF